MEHCHEPPPPDPATATATHLYPSSTLGPDEQSDALYFFSGGIHSNMLSDFAWIREGEGGLRLPENNINQSLSSSSGGGQDPPEISIASGGKKHQTPNKSKKKQKRMKQPRFAFMTKSETDNLEDGYRWRKYGQKAVKNSPFPRSYYRCTNSKCTVKKRVERSSADPSVVITTYEGQHCHHTVGIFHRGGMISHEFATFRSQYCYSPRMSQFNYPIQLPGENTLSSVSHDLPCQARDNIEAAGRCSADVLPEYSSLQPLMDDGLLGDIVAREIYNATLSWLVPTS